MTEHHQAHSGAAFPSDAYGMDYYHGPDGQPQRTFALNELTVSRARAILEHMNVPPGGRVLDYGCGLGALTAAFNMLGMEAVGVDPSPHAVEHALPEARGLVQHLGERGIFSFVDDPFDLIVAKDVFEHIDERHLHAVADRLLCLGKQVLAIIPVVDKNRKFIFDLYEHDATHVTRLTTDEWLGFFPYTVAENCHRLTPHVRRPDKIDGTLCLRLAEPDPQRQQFLDWARTPLHQPLSHRIMRRLLRI